MTPEQLYEELTLTVSINEHGVKTYLNKKGELHRIHGPACVHKNGTQYWYQNGKLHREDGPAKIFNDGTGEWWEDGRFVKYRII